MPAPRTFLVMSLLALPVLALTVRVDVQADPPEGRADPVDALAWMAGCWAGMRPARSYEEQWMAPRGGVMLGMSRSVRDGRATGHEFLRIAGGDEGLVYHAAPSGQAPTEFVATAIGGDTAVFENPAHDFPTRITYRRGTGDSLWARAEAPGPDGRMSGVELRMGKVACP
ncbi:MAG: hypothetical protein KY453_08560 [Gemmatimonadetes bacterium]|nr:hypothetical protein [Gemmatimonadota bacterium]